MRSCSAPNSSHHRSGSTLWSAAGDEFFVVFTTIDDHAPAALTCGNTPRNPNYRCRTNRRAQDAIAEIHFLATHGYEWVLEADIQACFDEIGHTPLVGRMRRRITDKRIVTLVKSFLGSGVMTTAGEREQTLTGTPQGGILSPLLANIALSALDEHFDRQWRQDMGDQYQRAKRKAKGQGSWRIVRYADDCAPRTQLEVAM